MFNDKTILITGGTGSFGKNFTKHLLQNYQPKKVIIFSRDELKQTKMRAELADDRLRFFIGDVRDLPRLERALYGVDIVVHAAALKQVPLLEYNPYEAVKTNIVGTQNVIEACIDQGVDKAVFVSTDKAAYPVNLYGSTKLCAEKLFVNGNIYSAGRTKFACVRYGNVLGSRGSLIDLLINGNGSTKIKLTDQRMTRFWINLSQACSLVVFAVANMSGGEIFVPKIPSMKVVDLFEALLPGQQREIIGIRPGEKLHEVLVTKEEARHAVELDKYFVILPESRDLFNYDEYEKYFSLGQPLTDEFTFASDQNSEWLTAEQIKILIAN